MGIVHSFARPVIALVDSAKSLPFDAHDERVIELGEYSGSLSATQAEEAKVALERALDVVLASGYVPASPLAEVAAGWSLDRLAPENPIAAELAAVRESMAALRTFVAEQLQPLSYRSVHNTTIEVGDALDAAVDRLTTSLLLRGLNRDQAIDILQSSRSHTENKLRETLRILEAIEERKTRVKNEDDRIDPEDSP